MFKPLLLSSFAAAIVAATACAPDPVPEPDAGREDDDDDTDGVDVTFDAGTDVGEGPADVRLPTNLPEGTELVDLGVVGMEGGRSPEITVDVGADVYSFVVLAYAQPGVSVLLERVEAPDGTMIVDDVPPDDASDTAIAVSRGFPGQFLSSNRVIPSKTSGAFLVPNSPDVPFPTGTYKVVVGSYDVAATQSGFVTEPHEEPVHVALLVRRAAARPTQGTLDLSLWFTGASDLTATNAPDDAALQAALGVMRSAYAAQGVDVGDVRYVDLDDASLRTVVLTPDTCEGGDLDTLLTKSGDGEANTVNLFFVERFQCVIGGAFDLGQMIGGISGGIPGIPYAQGTTHSGVAASTVFLADNPDTFAVVVAHETAHFLGLYHTQENNVFGGDPIYDNISDTPDDAEGARTNLMYFSAESSTSLSDGQGFVMRNNPWVKP